MMRILIIYQIIKAKKLCRTYFLGFGTAFYHIDKNSFILKSIKKVDQPFYSANRVGLVLFDGTVPFAQLIRNKIDGDEQGETHN